ncbi:MAG: hypothetical protein AB7T38_16335 [Nitrospirales bacterium]
MSDESRLPWLHSLRSLLQMLFLQSPRAIITCSTLKQSCRDWFFTGNGEVALVYLRDNSPVIRQRFQGRTGHVMDSDLLSSQFSDLEEPQDV